MLFRKLFAEVLGLTFGTPILFREPKISDGNSLLNSVTNSNRSSSFHKPGFLICSLLFLLFYTNDSFTHHSMGLAPYRIITLTSQFLSANLTGWRLMYTLLLNSIDSRIVLFNLQAIFRRNCSV